MFGCTVYVGRGPLVFLRLRSSILESLTPHSAAAEKSETLQAQDSEPGNDQRHHHFDTELTGFGAYVTDCSCVDALRLTVYQQLQEAS